VKTELYLGGENDEQDLKKGKTMADKLKTSYVYKH
jgi:hypothetical protein